MRRLSALRRARVMSRQSAARIGAVQRVLFDPSGRRVTAVQLAKKLLVDWDAVTGLGGDAVVVEDESGLRGPADEREDLALAGRLDPLGKPVLTDRGDSLGRVADVELDERAGSVSALLCDGHRVDGDRLLALGPYCIVVRSGPAPGGRA